ncbi:MAG TPA: histidine kinase dimerization/phospho-acceptor domain-containing protein, partial [Chitinophagaceae bacterium]|nr:histidine kinase dimerization/phospho-acceptor domain-containing protein [Chitinophagaceae bacterium]
RESIEADTTLHPFSSSDPGGQSALLRIQNVVTALCGMRPGCRARWYIPSTIPSQTTDSCSNSIVLHFKMATGDTTCLLCIEKIRDYETGAGSSWLSNSNSDQLRSEMYSYAIYRKGLLDEHQGVRVFPYRLDRKDGMKNSGTVHFSYSSGDSQLWLRDEITDTDVVVWKKYNPLYLFTTLFAYIFFIYFVTVSLYILGNIIARSNLHWKRFLNLLSLNLRLRIHFSILIVELFSFAIIGYISTQFLSGKVNERMKLELSTNTFQIQKEISQWPDLVTSTGQASGQAGSLHVRELQEMADRYGSSLNMYQINNGELQYAAMPELFSREIFSRRLDASIWHAMKTGNQNVLIREEQVGSLKYLCSYGLLQNADRQAIGIVQLPLFLSNAELRTETSTITTTLINIYIFVFLASALIAYFLTKSVTRPFSYIVKQFTKINLTKTNEPLQWFDSDEIGLLIKEYNRMLRKLENSTVLLAKTEREMAWREMAKQVAHEIKNPLTPMKLSLQMLERAIHNKAANVDEIAMKVSKTLVEQIDNLSLIASNFSDFAKLPVSKNEVFSLNNLLYAVTGMYHDDQHNDFEFQIPEYEIFIFADRSQLIRVLTNIIQNAIQSIPEERKGK